MSQNVPKCPKMSQDAHFRRIVVRTDLLSTDRLTDQIFIDWPPDRLLHTKRSLYQSGIWSRCLEPQQNLPSPEDYGWKDSNRTPVKWEPLWMTQSEASKACREFVKCGCTTICGSSARCSCKSADLRCTLLCKCKCTDKLNIEWKFLTKTCYCTMIFCTS